MCSALWFSANLKKKQLRYALLHRRSALALVHSLKDVIADVWLALNSNMYR